MKSYCCRSPWCNCGYFEENGNSPPCAEEENQHDHHGCCCCCCCCCCGHHHHKRFCYNVPVEPFCNCGCNILSC